MTRTSSSKPFSSTRRNGRGRGEGGGKRFSVFDFSEEDVRVEKVSRSLLGKFSARRSSPVTKHQFLHCCECFVLLLLFNRYGWLWWKRESFAFGAWEVWIWSFLVMGDENQDSAIEWERMLSSIGFGRVDCCCVWRSYRQWKDRSDKWLKLVCRFLVC